MEGGGHGNTDAGDLSDWRRGENWHPRQGNKDPGDPVIQAVARWWQLHRALWNAGVAQNGRHLGLGLEGGKGGQTSGSGGPGEGLSRIDTSLAKYRYIDGQLPLDCRLGSRAWVRRALKLRIAEKRKDRDLVADVVKRRHYLGGWPCRPNTLMMSFIADLAGLGPGKAGAAGVIVVSLQPTNTAVRVALDLHLMEVLELNRMWRADDLTPDLTPDFTPEMLRRVVRGERSRGPLRGLREEWLERKCTNLRAEPRLLVTFADTTKGHDGATYVAAGATFCGVTEERRDKYVFAWALDPALRGALSTYGRAVEERLHERMKDR